MTPSAVMDICRLFAAPSLWLCPNTVFPLRKPVPAIPYPAVAHRPLRTDFLAPPLAQSCFGVSQNCRRFFWTQSVSHSWLQILTCPLPPVNAMVRPFLPGTHKGGHSAWEVPAFSRRIGGGVASPPPLLRFLLCVFSVDSTLGKHFSFDFQNPPAYAVRVRIAGAFGIDSLDTQRQKISRHCIEISPKAIQSRPCRPSLDIHATGLPRHAACRTIRNIAVRFG